MIFILIYEVEVRCLALTIICHFLYSSKGYMNDLNFRTSCTYLFPSCQQNFQFTGSIIGLSFGKLINVHR